MRADSPVEHFQSRDVRFPSSVPLSDLDHDQRAIQEQRDMAAPFLNMLGHVLDGADDLIGNLERDPTLLPHAILRRCSELADMVGGLASELKQQSPEYQQQLASAIHDDLNSLRLQIEPTARNITSSDDALDSLSKTPTPSTIGNKLSIKSVSPTCIAAPPLEMSSEQELVLRDALGVEVSESDVLQALAGASSVLSDVEAAFREVGKDDAEEIADVAVTLARLFLMSLQNVYATLTPDSLVESTSMPARGVTGFDRSSPSTVVIEELADLADTNEQDENEVDLEIGDLTSKGAVDQLSTRRRSSQRKVQRVRVLWPPIGPHVNAAVGWTQDEARKRPLLAAALGLTLWPVVISTAFLGGTACVLDRFLQDSYDHFQGPVIENLEQGAASVYQAGKLSLVTGKLVGKQTWRVIHKQIERNGGMGRVVEKIGGMALDRVTHPVETVGFIWSGVTWVVDRTKDTVDKIVSIHQEGLEAQDLQ